MIHIIDIILYIYIYTHTHTHTPSNTKEDQKGTHSQECYLKTESQSKLKNSTKNNLPLQAPFPVMQNARKTPAEDSHA